MGTSNGRDHRSQLKGPVLRAIRIMSDDIENLALHGPVTYYRNLDGAANNMRNDELTRRILGAVAGAIEEYTEEYP